MIYIFDDRAQRRKENEEKLRTFSDVVKFETLILDSGRDLEESIVCSLDNPDCILFHKSYRFGEDDHVFEKVRECLASYGVPVVIFSGGIENGNKGGKEIYVNADVMYRNLPYFLTDFSNNGKINIDTLLWGKRHRLNALLNFRNELSKSFFLENDFNESIGGDISGVRRQDISGVRRQIVSSCRNFDVEQELREDILAELDKSPGLTWLELSNIIENNIHKYE